MAFYIEKPPEFDKSVHSRCILHIDTACQIFFGASYEMLIVSIF